jgi:hypothetical protein
MATPERREALMPVLKCLACKTRLYSAADPHDGVGDLCPSCGSLLEPVGEPAEVAGFRSFRARARAADGGASGTHQRIADRFGDFIARREAFLAQAQLDSRRSVDDDGRFRPEQVPVGRRAGTTIHPSSPVLERSP